MKKLIIIFFFLPYVAFGQTWRILGGDEYFPSGIGSDGLGRMITTDAAFFGNGGFGGRALPHVITTNPANKQMALIANNLHHVMFVDADSGYMYFVGYQGGMPSLYNGSPTAYKILTDSAGSPFYGVKAITPFWQGIQSPGETGGYLMIVNRSGTGPDSLFGVGDLRFGMRGTYPGLDSSQPVYIPLASPPRQITCITHCIILCNDDSARTLGGGWDYGFNMGLGDDNFNSYSTNHPTTYFLPQNLGVGNIRMLAGGGDINYILTNSGTLLQWGLYGFLMGRDTTSSNDDIVNVPTSLTPYFTLPSPIDTIVTNQWTTYMILNNGALYAMGSNEVGQCGVGTEVNWAAPGSAGTVYAWNDGVGVNTVFKPTQVAVGKNNWKTIVSGNFFCYQGYAQDSTGNWYSWGDGKASRLLDRFIMCDSSATQIDAAYPQARDRTFPTLVAVIPSTTSLISVTTCPYCTTGGQGSSAPCNNCTYPSDAGPAVGLTNQNVSTSSTTITPTITTTYPIQFYTWSQVSGPTTAVAPIVTGATLPVGGLATGTYQFKLVVKDAYFVTDSATVNVTVSATSPKNQLTSPVRVLFN
jgi:hypothetical protein